MTIERVFLGWDEPFLGLAADHLLSDRDALPATLVIVPTSQAGRRLREAMAEKAGALLSPRFVTPGSLLKTPDPSVAADWIEQLAWIETLEEIDEWTSYAALLPEAPEQDSAWAEAMSLDLLALRRSLQEGGLTLEAAASILRQSIEAERWACLKRLEKTMESKLRQWGYESRSRVLARGLSIPAGISRIALVGLTELPPVLRKSLNDFALPMTSLIGAVVDEADFFCEFGCPLLAWSDKFSPLPDGEYGSVHLVADAKQQAAEAVRLVAEAGTRSADLAIGCGDPGDGEALAFSFCENGWPAFHPGARSVGTGIARWFAIWAQWLAKPDLKLVADLLALPETEVLVGPRRAEISCDLAQARHDFMISDSEDLRRLLTHHPRLANREREIMTRLLPVLETFEKYRYAFIRDDAFQAIRTLIDLIASREETPNSDFAAFVEFLDLAAPLMRRMKRRPDFWVSLMLSQIPSAVPKPPEDRVIDIQGWLELFFEPGRHLVLCGMNEGRVPGAASNDPWLGENARQRLGLITADQRAARDAFLFQSMIKSRRNCGRVNIICSKTGSRGEALLPSRLLLNTTPEELPHRVKTLFSDIPAPESSLVWERDWPWQIPSHTPKEKISASALRDYIACPFRYFLKHLCDMRTIEPDRKEWNAREFGNVLHWILEDFGNSADAKDSSDPEFIGKWFSARLDEIVAMLHGPSPALAIRIQAEALRQRLLWTARIQAQERATGWQIMEVERKISIPVGDMTITARIDRIDRHEKTGALRVVDYKTGSGIKGVKESHMKKRNGKKAPPAHLAEEECPLFFIRHGKSSPEIWQWTDLQLPLYAQGLMQSDRTIAMPAYLIVGSTPKDVRMSEWSDFSENDLKSAMDACHWIAEKIKTGVYWPPAENPVYDDFAILSCGKPLSLVFNKA